MRTRRVLITGGAGFIGSHIAEQLAHERPREIVVYDDFSRGRRDNLAVAQALYPITIIEGDVRDVRHLRHAMEDIDCVFHQAVVRQGDCSASPRLAMDVVVGGTFNVLEAAAGAGVSRVITTSCEIVDTGSRTAQQSKTIHAAVSGFGLDLFRSFAEIYGLAYINLQHHALYGPGMDMKEGLGAKIAEWIRCVEAGSRPIVPAGKEQFGLLHVREIARAAVLAAESPVAGQVLNAGAEVYTTYDEIAACIERIVGEVDVAFQNERLPSDRFGVIRTGLDERVAELVHWWREQTVGEMPFQAIQTLSVQDRMSAS